MSLTTSLLHARSGLIGAQAGLDVVSRNIANATTEGYTKKIHNQSNLIIGGTGSGVRTDEVTRKVTDTLQQSLREQAGTIEKLEILDDFLGRLELEFGRPDDQSSISAKLTDLKKGFQVFSTAPENATNAIGLIATADTLSRSFNDLNSLIQDLRVEADGRISDRVTEVNSSLTGLQDLNRQIGQKVAAQQSSADLEDQRDQLLLTINENLSIGSFERTNSKITVSTAGGRLMLDDTRIPMSFVATSSLSAATNGQPVQLGGADVTSSITAREGSIAGLLNLRDTVLPEFQVVLDDLAFKVAGSLGTVNVGGTNEDLNLFTDAAGNVPAAFTAGFSGTIRVRAALLTTPTDIRDPQPGAGYTPLGAADNAIPLAVLSLFESQSALSQAAGVNNTMEGFSAALIGKVANQKADYDTQLTFQKVFRDGLRDRVENESGVNTDEELTELIRLEAAYGASARVLNAVQRAFDDLISIL
ncbi:flagellar hook-associated protein FlgK [Rhodospirillaceae bacterium]|nr:flagellar hook-associated protein FlgK [Alphaproteobacteria bacterium]MDC1442343.1 flagellar hook-associated protein FlgK [Rhodospirillaceae bacterium]